MGSSWEHHIRQQPATPEPANPGFAMEAIGEPLYSLAMVRPMLAGAQARGMSDVLDLMGLGAILMDDTGTALQANATACGLFGKSLLIANRHLVAGDVATTRALQDMIRHALEGSGPQQPVVVDAGESQGTWLAEARLLPNQGGDSSQLLKMIVILRKA